MTRVVTVPKSDDVRCEAIQALVERLGICSTRAGAIEKSYKDRVGVVSQSSPKFKIKQ